MLLFSILKKAFIMLFFLLFSAASPYLSAQLSEPGSSASGLPHDQLLKRYCVTCHNSSLETGGLVLEYADVTRVADNGALWEKVVRKLRTGSMPPVGIPRPQETALNDFVGYLESELDHLAMENPDPGRPVVHRLNRNEYGNAVHDLLAIDIDVESLLPNDDTGYGFDTVGEALSISPLLAEAYMATAREISAQAVGNREIQPYIKQYQVNRRMVQDDRISEDLPFGTRGGLAVSHRFPLSGEYEIKIRLQRNNDNYIRGLGEPHKLDIRLDGELIKSFEVGGDHKGRSSPLYSFINKDYVGDPEQEQYEFTADDHLEIRMPVQAGQKLIGVAFVRQLFEAEGRARPRQSYEELLSFKGGQPAVDTISISGPYNPSSPGETESRDSIFVCYPSSPAEEMPCAERILSSLARKAYRRPLEKVDIETLRDYYSVGYNVAGFEEGIRTGIQGILISPNFLFRIEQQPADARPGKPYPVSDLELATRLSFFLWSSIPDEELLRVAEAGRLRQPEVLANQVERMLADARARQLVDNFTIQWLGLQKLDGFSADPDEFPFFDENLRDALRQETLLFAEAIAEEDRSLLEWLSADFTFLNERLARHYQIPDILGSGFRRVNLDNKSRKGLLGKGSVLTVTSYTNRTSPTLRGKWVMENIMGTPPPPPPPNVPTLDEGNTENGRTLTMRERMERHRANPVCAVCHNRMDPLGFALDNFNAVGHWREHEGATPIDPSGVLPDGTRFQGPAELTAILNARPEQFLHTITEKLLTYALGRGLTYSDQAVVREIIQEAAADNYRWSAIILEIVNSMPFQMRRASNDDI